MVAERIAAQLSTMLETKFSEPSARTIVALPAQSMAARPDPLVCVMATPSSVTVAPAAMVIS